MDTGLFALADAAAQAQPSAGSQLLALGGPILIIVVMFYFMYRSNKKEQKRREDMITSVKTGDKVLSVGGIYGIVANVKDDCFVVKVADNVKIEMAKSAVSAVVDKDAKEERK
jgi:preprotein translocase subunit YajC